MRTVRRTLPSRQAGFSIVELLMTAFILAVGILGLSMLQVMSIRASRGSRSLSTGTQLADRLMDQVEMEGRLTMLDITDSQLTTKTVFPSSSGPRYVNQANPVTETFDINGNVVAGTAPEKYFTTTTTRQNAGLGAALVVDAGRNKQMHDFTVTVDFNDTVDATHTVIHRNVSITRRIIHGDD